MSATEREQLEQRIQALQAVVAAYANPKNWRPLHGVVVGKNEKPLLIWNGGGEGPDRAKGAG